MNKKERNSLMHLCALVSYWIIVIIVIISGGTTISYSKAINIVSGDIENVKSIVMDQEKHKVTLYVIENGIEKKYKAYIPDENEFVDIAMEASSTVDSNVEISMAETGNLSLKRIIYNMILYYIWIIVWKAMFKYVFKPRKDKDNKGKKSKNDNSKKTLFGIDTESQKNVSFKQLFEDDFSDDISSHLVKETGITFKDVAGMEVAKETMKDIADGIMNEKKYADCGAKIPSGVLLEGNPGVGKTLLAKALAGELKIPFIQYSASEMQIKWYGDSEKKVREIFAYARKNAPCIIFFDEIDSIATSRKNYSKNSNYDNLLNQILTCLDGFTPRDGVIFMAATNIADKLDEAIKRPGRFDRIIHVELPNVDDREEILKVHSRNKKLSSEIDLRDIARNTEGLSGAYLANIMNEAAILQIKADHECIMPEDINEAHRIVLFGAKSSMKHSDEELNLTAIHEIGHALTSKAEVKEISVIPRGDAGGYTWYQHQERSYITSSKLKEKLISYLGGRAAEEVMLGEISTGAQSDMDRAWKIARDCIVKYGMSEKFGPISIRSEEDMSDSVKDSIFYETSKMIEDAYEEAKRIIIENKEIILEVAEVLKKKKILLGSEYYQLIQNKSY